MEHAEGRFVLGWREWTLWFIPAIATLYFVWVLLVALNTVKTPTVDLRTWALLGVVLFAILIVLEFLLLMRKGGAKSEPAADADDGESIAPYAPPARPEGAKLEAEYAATAEQYKGMKVLELSIPPKSRNRGGVYAKSYVQVTPDMVLRIEDLVADKKDLPPMSA